MSSTTPAGERSGATGLRLLYLLTFLYVGGHGNFFPLWLRESGWTPTELGWLDGVKYMTVIVLPLYWGRLIDRRGDAIGVLKWVALGCLLTFVPVLFSVDFWVVLGALTLWAVFRVGQIPALDALTLSHVKRHGGTYGRFRSWGSLGFIVGGVLLGWLVSATDRSVIPMALMGTLGVTVLLIWSLRPEPVEPRPATRVAETVKRLLADRSLRAVYIAAFLSRLTQHGLYGFLPLHLQDLGVEDWAVPWFWAVGVMSEILLIRNTRHLFAGRSTRLILVLCFAAAVVQFGLTALVTSPLALLAVMSLHGVTFGVWYVASMEHLGAKVDEADRGTAQALFQITAFGFGGTLSAVAAGYLFEAGSGPLMFGVAAAASTVVVVSVWFAFGRVDNAA